VHRIGRTARAGRQGQSLLFLTENESPYIAYLKQKTVEFESDSVVPSVTSETSDIDADEKLRSIMQEEMLVDKDLIDKS
jgi:superfamily II DNA/RNA helicase